VVRVSDGRLSAPAIPVVAYADLCVMPVIDGDRLHRELEVIPWLVAGLDVSDNAPVLGVFNYLVDVTDHLRPIEIQIKPKLDSRFSVRGDPDDLPRSLLLVILLVLHHLVHA